jgi:hypothetical protein
MIDAVHAELGEVRLVDLGGTPTYWSIVPDGYLATRNVRITLVNLPDSETSAPDDAFETMEADACDLGMIADHSYDIVHSNSVLEHVGDWTRMVRFATEARRIAPRYFVQTPNYWFPVEPHCMVPGFQWLPKAWRVALVQRFELGHWRRASTPAEALRIVESARLLSRRQMKELFPDAELVTERLFLLSKSFIAIRA